MSLEDLYRQAVLDHNRSPRHFGELAHASHGSRGRNALCGDDLTVELRISEDGCIDDIAFRGEASAITMASASMMTDGVIGKSIDEARELYERFRCLLLDEQEPEPGLIEELGELSALAGVRPYPSRARSATLPWATLMAAIRGDDEASIETR